MIRKCSLFLSKRKLRMFYFVFCKLSPSTIFIINSNSLWTFNNEKSVSWYYMVTMYKNTYMELYGVLHEFLINREPITTDRFTDISISRTLLLLRVRWHLQFTRYTTIQYIPFLRSLIFLHETCCNLAYLPIST